MGKSKTSLMICNDVMMCVGDLAYRVWTMEGRACSFDSTRKWNADWRVGICGTLCANADRKQKYTADVCNCLVVLGTEDHSPILSTEV